MTEADGIERTVARGRRAMVAAALLALSACERGGPAGDGTAPEPETGDAVMTFYQEVAWSPDGEWLTVSVREISQRRWEAEQYGALEGTQYDIHLLRSDGSGRRPLTATPDESELWAAWSPDGSRIAFVSEGDGEPRLHVMRPHGGAVTALGLTGSAPSWSPDGARLAFTREIDGHAQILVARLEGDRAVGERQLTRDPANHWNPRWSPDGGWLLYYTDRKGSGNDQLAVVRPDGTGERALTDDAHNNFFPSWSADGARVLFTTNRDGAESIWALNADGTGLGRVLAGAFFVSPSPDGRRLAFITGKFPDSAVYVGDLTGIGPLVAD